MLENNTLYKIYKMYIKMFGLRWPTGSSEIPTGFPATCRPFWPSYLPVTSLACPWGGPHVIWGQLCWLWPNLFIHRARYRWTQRSVDFTCPSSVACPPCWLTAPSPPTAHLCVPVRAPRFISLDVSPCMHSTTAKLLFLPNKITTSSTLLNVFFSTLGSNLLYVHVGWVKAKSHFTTRLSWYVVELPSWI